MGSVSLSLSLSFKAWFRHWNESESNGKNHRPLCVVLPVEGGRGRGALLAYRRRSGNKSAVTRDLRWFYSFQQIWWAILIESKGREREKEREEGEEVGRSATKMDWKIRLHLGRTAQIDRQELRLIEASRFRNGSQTNNSVTYDQTVKVPRSYWERRGAPVASTKTKSSCYYL